MPSLRAIFSTALIAALTAVSVLMPAPYNHIAAAFVSAVALWLKPPGVATP